MQTIESSYGGMQIKAFIETEIKDAQEQDRLTEIFKSKIDSLRFIKVSWK